MPLTRRDLDGTAALTAAGFLLTGTVGALATAPGALAAQEASEAASGDAGEAPGYGPLLPDPAGVLALPAGFSYRIITHSGVTTLESGEHTPSRHSGTAAFEGPRGATLLVNNHALSGPRSDADRPVPLTGGLVHDPAAAGGCTVVEARPGGGMTERTALAGTCANRAGGSTPWGTSLSCEGNAVLAGQGGMTKDHGYVFEVDPHERHADQTPRPVKAFGRYAHEAVVFDPRTGYVYLTENASGPNGLFYRWVPPHGFTHGRGRLRGLADDAGLLQAPRCFDAGGRFVDDLSRAVRPGTVYGVDWVDVPDRDARTVDVRRQFPEGDVTRARKLEGMWWADGGAYFVSAYARDAYAPDTTPDGRPYDGQVWFYSPRRRTLTLKVLISVPGDPGQGGAFDGPGHITVSPSGGLVVAADRAGRRHLFGATEHGRTYPVARNDLNGDAFTGAVFSPDGRTLYASLGSPGLMLAITGPWRRSPQRPKTSWRRPQLLL
ncbi:alkaline phosphatase PhoX [Streptomyces sp. NPDC088725]|uniref:alkaline phosphatase PhoX n=1 Tax=Streptomyces sp. NPDC088725 TaxID=3365873 RepID=UPI003813EE1D